jgi:feruloyl-CoA synthase
MPAPASTNERRFRDVRFWSADVIVERKNDGVIYMRSVQSLGAYPAKITERLEYWATHASERVFLAQRDAEGDWRKVTYSEALQRVRDIAQGLIDRGLSVDRPLAILSGNSIEHALLALAAMYAGVLYTPISPAYSRGLKEYKALKYLWEHFRPAAVFAAEGAEIEPALRSVERGNTQLICSISRPESIPSSAFAELEARPATSAVDDAHARVTSDTIAKILYTSGSTGHPKGVITTQRMMCSNQETLRSVFQFVADEPPVLCDWLPWNHVFGGSHNFGFVLYNGGTLYIDEGKPVGNAFASTLANLREVSPTAYFNVPKGYELLLPALRADRDFREHFFRRLKMVFYAGASIRHGLWDELQELAVDACGENILTVTSLGCTETAPAVFATGSDGAAAGVIGLPMPGVEVKLVPVGPKIEARTRGPNVTPGYWRDHKRTREAFDEEGFYRMGDALKFVDSIDPQRGLAFDGRITEDFKLSSGTWVSVGPLRAKLLAAFGELAMDVVIAAPDREYVAALVFPNVETCRNLTGATEATRTHVLGHSAIRDRFAAALASVQRESTGSSTRVERIILLDEPPSLERREITDKGSINQRAVVENRNSSVKELYAEPVAAQVIQAPTHV